MCLLLFYLNPDAKDDEYYLILINVRDEIFNRPTSPACFWTKYPDVIGGMDAMPGRKGGTWLAMSKSGRVASLLNVLQPDEEILEDKKGRGFLVVDYVTGNEDCLEYLKNINKQGNGYNGFTLVTLDLSSFKSPKIAYFSNMSSLSPISLQPGFHAFGNSTSVDCPWPKVIRAKEKFVEAVKSHSSVAMKDLLVEELFHLLKDPTCYTLDENMKKQGKSKTLAFLDKLSSIFVNIPEYNYGSRCHTIILIDRFGKVDYYERNRSENSALVWNTQHYTFQLSCRKL